MKDDMSGFGWYDDDCTEQDAEHTAAGPSGVEALEQWLENNQRLWSLGLELATTAQCFRRRYAHIPFNQSGWYSPN